MKVMLATDGSQHATEAASLLAHLPHREPLELTVANVSYQAEFHGSMEVMDWMEKNRQAERERAEAAYMNIEEMFAGANATLQPLYLEGQVGRTLVDEAKSRDIELIVLGAVGHSTIDRLLLGSTSDFVAVHAHCSVLVVRSTNIDRHAPRICWAFDDSEPALRAIAQVGQFDWGSKTHVDVVNVVPIPQAYSEIPIIIDTEAIQRAMLPKVKAAAEQAQALTTNVTPHVLDAASVGDGLVRFAEKHESDLIVMGDTGRGLLSRFLLGSVSRYVLRHARASVWLARGV